MINPALQTHFLNLYAMALSDTQFDEVEISLLYKIAAEKGISRNELDKLILNPATVKFHYPETVNQKIQYLYDYAKMILADGVIDPFEMKTFEKFCLKFEFQEENVNSIMELLIEAAKNHVPDTELIDFVNQTA